MSIIVVDDEECVRTCVRELLEIAGYRALAVSSCEEMLDALDDALDDARGDAHVDLAIVDYLMGPPDGVETLGRLRERLPDCAGILMSGCLDLPGVADAVNGGAVTHVLAKPFLPADLTRAVEGALGAAPAPATPPPAAGGEAYVRTRNQLRACLETDCLHVALQPVVAAADGAAIGYTVRLRSSHEVIRDPVDLLRIAEAHRQTGALNGIVCDRAALCLDKIPETCLLFLKLHPYDLLDPQGLDDRLAVFGAAAQRVVIEIPVRGTPWGLPPWQEALDTIRARGHPLAADDVGLGLGSLDVLTPLHPFVVKVDRALVRAVDTDAQRRDLIALLARRAAAMGARLLAEGVETTEEADALRALGVEWLQGYLFGRPIVSDNL